MGNDLACLTILCGILLTFFCSDGKVHNDVPEANKMLLAAASEPFLFGDLDFQNRKNAIPDECSLVMAESTIPESGWGVFSLEPLRKGETLPETSPADIVIQLTDPNPLTANGMKKVIWGYLWDGQEVNGQYEGQRVMSFVPGIGMLANGEANMYNVLPGKPQTDRAGIDRKSSPGAGAITYYQNLTWKVEKDIEAGGEIFVNYGDGWFNERGYRDQPRPSGKHTVESLRQTSYCLDNLVPGKSEVQHAGRGAFAKRDLAVGTIVAPVPVLPLSSDSLKTAKEHESTGRVVVTEQLVRNYCYGHQNSSLLLYPYSSMTNLINHSSKGEANVKLRWSEGSKALFDKPIPDLQGPTSRLLLELVSTRSIRAGEEILLDYGKVWEQAWNAHVQNWKFQTSVSSHISSQDANRNKTLEILRTASELQTNPYPDNLFTSCFFRLNMEGAVADHSNEQHVFRWMETPRLTEQSRNLRPCVVVDRHKSLSGEALYTVRIFNRPGLAPDERVPTGRPYIVEGVPRYAIEFSDKLYTTDQHLENAFRKEIGLDAFPHQWMDLI